MKEITSRQWYRVYLKSGEYINRWDVSLEQALINRGERHQADVKKTKSYYLTKLLTKGQ